MFVSIIRRLKRLSRDESAPTAVQHVVVFVLIIVACVVSIRLVGTNTDSSFQNTVNALDRVQEADGVQDGSGTR